MPLISIVTINRNNSDGLRKTLDSVRAQTFREFELLVIDGGSSDQSMSVVDEFRDLVSYCVSEPDRGIAHAFNKGTQAATGVLVNYLNSGDCYLHDRVLERVAASYQQDGPWEWAYGLRKRIGHDGIVYLARANETTSYGLKKLIREQLRITHQAVFFELDKVRMLGGYDERFQWFAMDYDLILRFASRGAPVALGDHLVLYDTEGISAKNVRSNLWCKHEARVLRLSLPVFSAGLDAIRTCDAFLVALARRCGKSIFQKFSFTRRFLRVDD